MPVTVSPIQTINVRVNPQNQQVVQSSSQFVGASGALAQEALNLANAAYAQSNTAIALAEEAVANVHGDRLISTSNGQAILDSSNNFTIPSQLNVTTPGASISTTYFGGGGLVANANVADGITYTLLNVSNQYNQNLGDIYIISNGANTAEAYIDVNDGTTQRTFGFHTTGTFTLPNNAVIDDTTDTNSFYIKPGNTNKTLKLHSSDNNSGVDIQQTAVYIFTNSNNNAVRYWQFDSDGYIIFPDNSAQNTGFTSAYISQINDATNIANYASNKANNALANTSGTFGGDLTVAGNLSVLGTTTSVNTEIVNQQEIVTGRLTANSGIASTNTGTGSLIVIGGVGVSGNVYANNIYDRGIELLNYANSINNTAQAAFNAANNVSASLSGNTIILGSNTAGQLVSNAVTLTTATTITNGIAQLNQILGKLVPASPPAFPGAYGTLTITGLVGPYRMTNFTQQDNTNLSTSPVVSGGTSVSPLRTSSYTTSTIYLINTQAGDVMSVYKNNAISGTRTMSAGATNAGTYGDLHILTNVDYASTGAISYANFWYSANVNASGTVANGWNTVYITDTAGTKTANATWYYDNSAPGTPTFASPSIVPLSPSLTYSSTVPHYNSSTTFKLGVAVSKLSGDMYPASDTFFTGTAGGAFAAPASNTYTGVGITTPVARNLYVASGSAVVNTTSSIIAGFGSSSTGPSVTVDNSYSTASQSFTTTLANTVLYKTGTSSSMEETGFIASGFGTAVGTGNAVRIVNYDTGSATVDTPVFTAGQTAFNSQTGTFYASDATVVAGILKNDTTNYSTGYLPPGPNLSTQNAAQYITLRMTRSSVSKFSINYTTSTGIGGIWCAMPAQTSYSAANNWYSMTVDNSLAGGCALGGNLVPSATGAKVYNCQFAGLNSSNATNNEILVRIRLNAGQSITALSFAASTV